MTNKYDIQYKEICAEKYVHNNDDLFIVNVARESLNKRKEKIDKSDIRLLGYLAKEAHVTPFFHNQYVFRVRMHIREYSKLLTSGIVERYQFRISVIHNETTENSITFFIRGSFYAHMRACLSDCVIETIREHCPHGVEAFIKLNLIQQLPIEFMDIHNYSQIYKFDAVEQYNILSNYVEGEDLFKMIPFSIQTNSPIFVARQHFKSGIGYGRNEVSRRYIDEDPTYHKVEMRSRPEKSIKQGSSDTIIDVDTCNWHGLHFGAEQVISITDTFYKHCLEKGVAPEVARSFLIQSMNTEWIETAGLSDFSRYLSLRNEYHAQKEIRNLACIINNIFKTELKDHYREFINLFNKGIPFEEENVWKSKLNTYH